MDKTSTNRLAGRIETKQLSDLTPDRENANEGTPRGGYMLASSLERYGAGRSILIDRAGRIIAGNKTAERAAELGLEEVIVVQTDGHQLVAVQRVDLDLEEGTAARELAYADNRTGEVGLSWDVAQLLADYDAGVDLSGLFMAEELDQLLAEEVAEAGAGRKAVIRLDLDLEDLAIFERAVQATGLAGYGPAVIAICRAFLEEGELPW